MGGCIRQVAALNGWVVKTMFLYGLGWDFRALAVSYPAHVAAYYQSIFVSCFYIAMG